MSHSPREEILHRIRTGLKNSEGINHAETASFQEGTGPAAEAREMAGEIPESGDSKLSRFTAALGSINTSCHVLSNENELEEYITTYLHKKNISSFSIWETKLLKNLGIKGALEGGGASYKNPGIKDEIALAGIGITGVDYAIAETGTLVLLTDSDRPRGVSLIAPIHVAVLKKQNILNNIDELFIILQQKYNAAETIPSCTTFITGPSRTADIELNLTLGVHGPKELHVVIIP